MEEVKQRLIFRNLDTYRHYLRASSASSSRCKQGSRSCCTLTPASATSRPSHTSIAPSARAGVEESPHLPRRQGLAVRVRRLVRPSYASHCAWSARRARMERVTIFGAELSTDSPPGLPEGGLSEHLPLPSMFPNRLPAACEVAFIQNSSKMGQRPHCAGNSFSIKVLPSQH